MKLLTSFFVNRLVPCCHYAKGKPHTKKCPYIPWRAEEAIENIQETLSVPYEQGVPTNPVKRVTESNPAFHSIADVGKFYTMPDAVKMQYFQLGGFSQIFEEQVNIFNERCIMIRRPALEVIDYLKNANYKKLPVKYVLYGPAGCGKRTTLVHVLHYAGVNGFIILHLPFANTLHEVKGHEAHDSETREGLVDQPVEAAVLLKQFQLQNEPLVNQLELKTTKEYVWNLRESTPAGTPLIILVNHGINRMKFACDVLQYLIEELKIAATAERIKLLVAVGGLNAFYDGETQVKRRVEKDTTTFQLSIFQSFRSLLKPDWCNGAFVTYVCESSTIKKYVGSHMPFFLLRRQGFEELDPFIPVYVPELSELEYHSLLDYYEDRRWLQKPGAREEIAFLTSRNANEIRVYCAPL